MTKFALPMARTRLGLKPGPVKDDRISAEAYAYLVAIARSDGKLKF